MTTIRATSRRSKQDLREVFPPRDEHNATFHAFKQPWGKWGYSGRGRLPPSAFQAPIFAPEERLEDILKHNDGKWPGMSTDGREYFLVVIGDEDNNFGWPLMFVPTSR